jgi:NitT/TauT family transport system ATP-binding protein
MENSTIRIEGLSHAFLPVVPKGNHGFFLAIKFLDFQINSNTFVSILGPSGCGKTTLLRMMGGLISPTRGAIYLGESRVTQPEEKASMVFQDIRLLPWRNVLSNVEFPLELKGVAKEERKSKAMGLLVKMGLEKFASYYPHQTSGGMQQRVGLARSLITDPAFLLMDEPFGALDAQTREIMQIELLKLADITSKTIVFITHSIDEAILMSDEIILLSASPATIKERISINLPKPRWKEEVRHSVEFLDYRKYLWESLKSEIMKA